MAGRSTIDLLRHGETAMSGFRGRLDDDLNANGWEQMRRAALAPSSWQVVVSSPLKRCASFAQMFAGAHHLPCHLDARLVEMDFGDWEGMTAADLMPSQGDALARFWADPWQFGPPHGEGMAAFESRVRAAWHDLALRYKGMRVLVVTHGGVIRLLLCLDRQLPRCEFLQLNVPHASVHRIGVPDITTR